MTASLPLSLIDIWDALTAVCTEGRSCSFKQMRFLTLTKHVEYCYQFQCHIFFFYHLFLSTYFELTAILLVDYFEIGQGSTDVGSIHILDILKI